MTAVERMEAAWAAEYVTQDTDAATGVPRPDAIQACQVKAWQAAKEIPPGEHPIDRYLTEVGRIWWDQVKPRRGQWWTSEDASRMHRTTNAVRLTLKAIRSGVSPREARRLARHIARELPDHCQDEAEQKVNHYCRLAGLTA